MIPIVISAFLFFLIVTSQTSYDEDGESGSTKKKIPLLVLDQDASMSIGKLDQWFYRYDPLMMHF